MDIIKLAEFNTWAHRKIGEQIGLLPHELFVKDVGGSFGSIKATLVHILESDWLWLQRFNGIPLAEIPPWRFDLASELYKEWAPIQDEMLSVVRRESNNAKRKIPFLTRKGIRYELPLEDLVVHITNHGTYHRGQLTHMIRVAGIQPVSTDYFIFCTKA
jgi:uncharacterized damage-inducible protein DinB